MKHNQKTDLQIIRQQQANQDWLISSLTLQNTILKQQLEVVNNNPVVKLSRLLRAILMRMQGSLNRLRRSFFTRVYSQLRKTLYKIYRSPRINRRAITLLEYVPKLQQYLTRTMLKRNIPKNNPYYQCNNITTDNFLPERARLLFTELSDKNLPNQGNNENIT